MTAYPGFAAEGADFFESGATWYATGTAFGQSLFIVPEATVFATAADAAPRYSCSQ
jgi:hypothetical protein